MSEHTNNTTQNENSNMTKILTSQLVWKNAVPPGNHSVRCVPHLSPSRKKKWLRYTITELLQFSDSTTFRGNTWFFKLFQNHLTQSKSYKKPLTETTQFFIVCYPPHYSEPMNSNWFNYRSVPDWLWLEGTEIL